MACAVVLFATAAKAETLEELKRELAAKKAYISKLERRVRDLEKRPPAGEPPRIAAPATGVPASPRVPPPPAPDDDEMERALERSGAWCSSRPRDIGTKCRIRPFAIPIAPVSASAWACLGNPRSRYSFPTSIARAGMGFLAMPGSCCPKS